MTQDYGSTIRSSNEQFLENKNIDTAVTLSGSDLIWKLFSTRPAMYTLNSSGLRVASPERMVAGMEYTLALLQDTTGNRRVDWGAAFQWSTEDGQEPEPNTIPGALNVYKFYCDGTILIGVLQYKTQG